ncbi:MAG: hypothetical protein JWO76_1238 [Nocardioides sp.]|nr:hypothetical protein [Nocardioides sp.]
MLARLQKSMKEKDQGFTLIELLVVIVIIGILAAIAIPLFLNQQKKGVDASLKSDVKNAATTIETWRTDNPTSPVDPTASMADFTPSNGNTVNVVAGSDVGSYCIEAKNGASSDPTQYITYDSNAGGLQPGFSGGC